MFITTHPFARYNKFIVAALGVVASLWGPDISEALIALLVAIGVWVAPNKV